MMIRLSDDYDHRSNGADPLVAGCLLLCAAIVQRARKDAAGRLAGVPESLRSDVQREAAGWLGWLRNGCGVQEAWEGIAPRGRG